MNGDKLQRLVESNARVIQALSDSLAELTNDRLEAQRVAQEERSELRRAMLGIANLVSSLDSDRPTILSRLNAIEGKVDRLLEQDAEGA